MNCPYCGKEAKWCENKEIYGKNYGKSYMCYYCKDCGAYVGCHNNTEKALGTMANKELRDWRIKAHEAFDKLWKDGFVTRDEAYKILDKEFGKEVHIGEADIETCQRIMNLLNNQLLVKKEE
jgi:hypothetical protein